MSKEQQAAAQIMRDFVARHGGDPAEVVQVGSAYRWRAPDGRTASVGWER